VYKTIGIAVVLLAAFAFTSGSRSADASPTTPIGPAIVAHGKLLNQTTTLPSTTIFTPTHDGLYRLSVYATVSKADPSSQSIWNYNIAWTDDAGAESEGSIVWQSGAFQGQFQYEGLFQQGGAVIPVQAKAGTPITYSVIQGGSPDNSTYSLYYTLERLE
jgi:hypothetical protein